jgi:hypothetical protein
MGTWELVDISWGDLSYSESVSSPSGPGETSEDCLYTERLEGELVIDDRDGDDMEGELDLLVRQQMTGCGGGSASDRETFDVEADRDDRGEYELDVRDFYRFDCELNGDELDCRDDDGDDWTFERVE